MYYRQCFLQKKTTEGTINQVSYIPEEFAKVGKYVKLLENNKWEDGWLIVTVGGRQSKQERIDRGNDHKKQRKASDI